MFEALPMLLKKVLALNDEPRLRPGLDREYAVEIFREAGLAPPELVLRCYALHDGILHLNGFLHFLPLRESVDLYRHYRRISAEGGLAGWREGLFPLLDLNGDVQICLDFRTHAVSVVDVEDDSVQPIAACVNDLIAAVVETFDQGACEEHAESGVLRFDSERWEVIAARHGVSPPW
jgi:hypothetical protein